MSTLRTKATLRSLIARVAIEAALLAFAATASAAVITVDTLASSGGPNNQCALDQAVLSASLNIGLGGCDAGSSIGTDTIVFDPALFSSGSATIDLDGTLAASGSGLTIEGPTGADLVVNGNGSDPVLTMNLVTAAELTLRNFALNGGAASGADGAGIRILSGNAGDLRLENMLLADHSNSDSDGGAIGGVFANDININVIDSVFSNNFASGSGAAIAIEAGASTIAQLFVVDSEFSGNEAFNNAGAINLSAVSGSTATVNLNVSGSVFDSNSGTFGGAVRVATSNSLHTFNTNIQHSRFSNNTASGRGAGVYSNTANSTTEPGVLFLARNSFTGNVAGLLGSAVYSAGQNVLFVNNLVAENDADRGAAYLSVANATAHRTLSFYANTFIANTGTQDGIDWFLALPSNSALSDSRLEANLTLGLPVAGTFNCFLNNAFDRQAHNLANTDSTGPCHSPGLVADDLGISLAPVVHPVHEQAAIPAVGSPAVDGWPEADCNLDSGGDLETDLLGLRRAAGTGVPLDGDGDGVGDCDIGAFERPTTILRSLDVTIAGGGSVSSIPPGIDCPATACQADFVDGSSVTLTASPGPGFAFDGWSGDCSGTGTCQVVMDQARSVQAAFVSTVVTYRVDVELDGNGVGMVESTPAGIDCPGDCSEAFEDGESVTLNAIAGASSSFFGWSADCAAAGTGACQLTVDQAYRAIAIFGDGDLLFLDGFE